MHHRVTTHSEFIGDRMTFSQRGVDKEQFVRPRKLYFLIKRMQCILDARKLVPHHKSPFCHPQTNLYEGVGEGESNLGFTTSVESPTVNIRGRHSWPTRLEKLKRPLLTVAGLRPSTHQRFALMGITVSNRLSGWVLK